MFSKTLLFFLAHEAVLAFLCTPIPVVACPAVLLFDLAQNHRWIGSKFSTNLEETAGITAWL